MPTMNRLLQAVDHLRRHFRIRDLLALALAVGLCVVGGTEDEGWPCLVIAGLMGVGAALNILVILLNDGYMPARMTDLPPDYVDRYRPMDDRTRARALGDWIPVGPHLVRPGDLLLGGGWRSRPSSSWA
jgi:hypothetical protein